MSLLKRHQDTINLVKKYIMNQQKSFILKGILYGSCARDEADYDSDVDILIVIDDAYVDKKEIKDFERKMRSDCSIFEDQDGKYYPEVDIHFVLKSSYDKEESTYLKEIRKDGIVIYDRK
jgi:predicted nucleotidyltransferase